MKSKKVIIIIETDYVLCEIRAEAEERAEHRA